MEQAQATVGGLGRGLIAGSIDGLGGGVEGPYEEERERNGGEGLLVRASPRN